MMINRVPRMGKWEAILAGIFGIGVIGGGIAFYNTHDYFKDNAVEEATKTFSEERDSLLTSTNHLNKLVDSLDVKIGTTQEKANKAEALAKKRQEEVLTAQARVVTVKTETEAAFRDTLYERLSEQYLAHTPGIRNFKYTFEKDEDGTVALLINPLKDDLSKNSITDLEAVLSETIPSNLKEIEGFTDVVAGIFNKWDKLAKQHKLEPNYTSYKEIIATQQSNRIWNVTLVRGYGNEEKETVIEYYAGAD